MEITAKSTDRNLLLKLIGELDHHAARDTIRELDLAIDAALPRNLVLDMEGVTFMDSSGIGLIIGRCKNLKFSGGQATAIHLNQQMQRIFKISGLHKIIKVEEEQ